MLGSPRHELLIFGEHRVNELVQDVLGRLAKEVRVRVERFICLAVESCDVSHQLLAARAGFDEWHGAPFRSGNGTMNALRFEAPGATTRR